MFIRIVEITLAVEKLLEPSHHKIGNFAFGFQLRCKNANSFGRVTEFVDSISVTDGTGP